MRDNGVGGTVDLDDLPPPEADRPQDEFWKAQECPAFIDLLKDWQPPTLENMTRLRAVEFYVENWIQRRMVGTIVAEGGLGKTTLMLELAIATATGRPWLGQRILSPGTFVLLSKDDSQEDLDGKLADMLHDKQQHADHRLLTDAQLELVRQRVRLISLRGLIEQVAFTVSDNLSRGLPIANEGLTTKIVDALKVPNPVCIMFDTLRQFSGGNSNDERVMTIAIQAVTSIADRLGCVCIVPHHTGKAVAREGIDDMYSASGSSAIADNTRFTLRLMRTTAVDIAQQLNVHDGSLENLQDADLFVLSSTRGSLRVRKPPPLYYKQQGNLLIPIGGTRKTVSERQHDLLRRVIAVIDAINANGGTASGNVIRDAIGGSRDSRLAALKAFLDQGWLSKDGHRSPYRVTEAGRSVINPEF